MRWSLLEKSGFQLDWISIAKKYRERRGTLGSCKSGKSRPVYVNGVYCKSMMAAVAQATQISGTEVRLWHIQRAVNGGLKIKGVDISEKPPVMCKPVVQARKSTAGPLLRYPFGENPLDRGITKVWG